MQTRQISSLAAPTLVDLRRDESPHAGLPWEIWWITVDLRSSEGRRWAAHLLLTHVGEEGWTGELRATACLTDVDSETESSARTTTTLDLTSLATDGLSISTAVGSFAGSLEDGYLVRARINDDSGFELRLRPTRPVLYSGGAGQFTLGHLTTSQYSVGGLEASGTIKVDGVDRVVDGTAWYDRQWIHAGHLRNAGPFTWFGICLDNGDTISFWDTSIRAEGGRTWVTIVRPDGTHLVTSAEPAASGASEEWITPQGRSVPRRWRLVVPSMDAELDVAQRLVQDAPGFFFYTGALDVRGRYGGDSVTGHGFCDLVGWPEPESAKR